MPTKSPDRPVSDLPENRVTEEVLDLGDARVGLRRSPGRGHPLVMFHGKLG